MGTLVIADTPAMRQMLANNMPTGCVPAGTGCIQTGCVPTGYVQTSIMQGVWQLRRPPYRPPYRPSRNPPCNSPRRPPCQTPLSTSTASASWMRTPGVRATPNGGMAGSAATWSKPSRRSNPRSCGSRAAASPKASRRATSTVGKTRSAPCMRVVSNTICGPSACRTAQAIRKATRLASTSISACARIWAPSRCRPCSRA